MLLMVFASHGVHAQSTVSPNKMGDSPTVLTPVVVNPSDSARVLVPDFLGVGDATLLATPLSTTVLGSAYLEAIGAKRLADALKADASASDAYNAIGYWDYVSLRGFVLNNKYNFYREGLPISAESFIPLDNKASIDILKGTSGIQAGTSAPGGLVHYAVKRPTQAALRAVSVGINSQGSASVALDFGNRFGVDNRYGYRVNAALETLDAGVVNTQGKRQLLALAGDWRASPDALFQAEIEYSQRSQPSVPALSLFGNALPVPNPRLNINQQSWSQPVVLEGLTGSLKFEQVINAAWRWSAQAGKQKLVSQDRAAFPFGCSAEGAYDRYCSDGTFDVYDYRSENERRSTAAVKLALKGQLQTGSLNHGLGFSVQSARAKDQFQTQAYNWVGVGSVFAPSALPADATLTTPSTQRAERSAEFAAYDAIAWNSVFTTWAGLRHTQLQRQSIGTDGANETRSRAQFTAPWFAASLAVAPTALAYASYGQGVESEVAPNRAAYVNAGQVLPALKSQQFELGLKGRSAHGQWAVAAFQITRPAFGDAGACDNTANSCTRQLDGAARHRGLELNAASPVSSSANPWHFEASVSVLNAVRQGAGIDPSLNGLRPTNVPRWIARLNAEYRMAAVPGMTLHAHLSHEGERAVLQNNALNLPAWSRLDLALRYKTDKRSGESLWTLALDNALNKRYFSESPTQFGHIYLFSAAPRTLRLALQTHF